MENIINDEVQDFLHHLEAEAKDGVFKMDDPFYFSTFNILWAMVTGNRFDRHNCQRLQDLIDINHKFLKSDNFAMSVTSAFPILRKLFPNLSGRNIQIKISEELAHFMQTVIEEHRIRNGRKSDPQNFIDAFINQIENESGNPESYFTEEQLIITLIDFFQAGFETTANVINFGILFLILYPEEQRKVQNEIDAFIPQGILPSLADKKKMVYTHATVYEMLRFANVVPVPVGRQVSKSFFYEGYYFERGVTVFSNLHAVFTDQEMWEDPERFRPGRYILANGELDPSLCAKVAAVFGHGGRICPGLSLTMNTIFLFLTSMLQKMTLSTVPGAHLPSKEPVFGVTLSPRPYNLVATIRNS